MAALLMSMDKAYKIMLWVGWGMTGILLVLWPLLALPAGVFSKSYFTFWVILSVIWGFAATLCSESTPHSTSGSRKEQCFCVFQKLHHLMARPLG